MREIKVTHMTSSKNRKTKTKSKPTPKKINVGNINDDSTSKKKKNNKSIKSSSKDDYELFLAALINIHLGKYQYTIDTITREDRQSVGRGYMPPATYSRWKSKYLIPIKICNFNVKSDEFVDIDLYMDAMKRPEFIRGFKPRSITFKYQSLDGINTKYPNLNNCAKRNINKMNKNDDNDNNNGSINVISDMIDEMNDNDKDKDKNENNNGNLNDEIFVSNFGEMYDFNGKQRSIESSIWDGYNQDNLSQLLKDCTKFKFSKCWLKHIVEPKLLRFKFNRYQSRQNCNDIVCIGNKIDQQRHSYMMEMSGDQGTMSDVRHDFFILDYGKMSQDENYQLCLVWSGCYYRLSGSYSEM